MQSAVVLSALTTGLALCAIAPFSGSETAARGPHVIGAVTWHADFEAARAAAAQSGKPILLFQLLGELDDPFC